MKLDIEAARAARPYTSREYVGRMLWAWAWPLFRYSPRICFGWRRWLLRRFGAAVGRHVHIYPSVRVAIPWNLQIDDHAAVGEDVLIYNLGPVRIGARATVSHRAHLCAGTHDFRDPALPLLRLPITIGGQVWVCADAFVGPGVSVGEGAVVGAAAVCVKDVPAWTIVAGNPAVFIKHRELRGVTEG
ncbi:MAG: putative colanic acid biosynthesis acetyltransferase [Pseudomarimonas sp.]